MSKFAGRDTSNLTPQEVSLCEQFSEFTSASQEVAAICLRKNKWNIQMALDAFWENPESFVPPAPQADVGLLESLFLKYKDEDDDVIGVDGLFQFCSDINIPYDDVRILVFLFNLREFIQGMLRLGCDTLQKLVDKIPSMQADLVDPSRFKQFYAFAFDVSRSDGQKVLELETAIQLWKLVLATRFSHLDAWCAFLSSEYKKSITKDTWMLTYDFSQQANDTMSNIDLVNSAWPVVIDEFVEHYRAQQKT